MCLGNVFSVFCLVSLDFVIYAVWWNSLKISRNGYLPNSHRAPSLEVVFGTLASLRFDSSSTWGYVIQCKICYTSGTNAFYLLYTRVNKS